MMEEIKLLLPPEKPNNTVGRPVVPFRKVLDGIVYILRTGCQWKMLPKEYDSGSTCHRRFQEWVISKVFQKLWIRLLQLHIVFFDYLRYYPVLWICKDIVYCSCESFCISNSIDSQFISKF